MKVLVLNGPNLNLIEKRDSNKYGSLTLDSIAQNLKNEFKDVEFTFIQSNSEGELIKQIQNADNYEGVVINPGGYCHSSIGLRDALEMLKIPKIEVHLSNLAAREDFRKNLLTTSQVTGSITGLKEISYSAAVFSLIKMSGLK